MVMTTFITDLTSNSVTNKELLELIKDINNIFNYNKYIVHYHSYLSKTCFGFKTETIERYDVYYDYNMNCFGDVQALNVPSDYNSVYSYLLGVYNGLTETKKMSKPRPKSNSIDILGYQITKKQTSSNNTSSSEVYKTSSNSNSSSSNTINNNHSYDSDSSCSSGSSLCSDSSSSSSSSCD